MASLEEVGLDAACTIAAFGARLRQQVNLDTLTGELPAAVDQSMQQTRCRCGCGPCDARGRCR